MDHTDHSWAPGPEGGLGSTGKEDRAFPLVPPRLSPTPVVALTAPVAPCPGTLDWPLPGRSVPHRRPPRPGAHVRLRVGSWRRSAASLLPSQLARVGLLPLPPPPPLCQFPRHMGTWEAEPQAWFYFLLTLHFLPGPPDCSHCPALAPPAPAVSRTFVLQPRLPPAVPLQGRSGRLVLLGEWAAEPVLGGGSQGQGPSRMPALPSKAFPNMGHKPLSSALLGPPPSPRCS